MNKTDSVKKQEIEELYRTTKLTIATLRKKQLALLAEARKARDEKKILQLKNEIEQHA